MKLIYCPECHDVVKLRLAHTECNCGKSYGHYCTNGLDAVINETAIPLGIANGFFLNALNHRPASGMGKRFEAFVIPVDCPTVKVANYKRDKTGSPGMCPKCDRYGFEWDGRAKGWLCHYKSCNYFIKENA